ncbi:MAG: twin-arginine translocation signal domain-containing protein, partial [Acidobacteria bacterium]|nr:twin-arginine translocation signal domain-containing protein [Acidobacteriota bacterium]
METSAPWRSSSRCATSRCATVSTATAKTTHRPIAPPATTRRVTRVPWSGTAASREKERTSARMSLSRRQFLKWAGVTGIGAVIFNGCRVPDHEIEVQSPVQMPEDLVTGRDNFYATVAQFDGASEGLLVRVMEGRAKKVEGNPDYPLNGSMGRPLNTGKHSIRSEALLQAAYHPDRIKTPLVRIAKGGPFRRIGWPDAITRLTDILRDADPASVLLATSPVRGR